MGEKWKSGLSGGLAGAVNGLLGAGGGMVLVPLLGRLCRVTGKTVFATSVAVILPLCLVSLTVMGVQSPLPWQEAVPYLIGGGLGGIASGFLFPKMSPPLLHKILGCFIVWGGIQLVR